MRGKICFMMLSVMLAVSMGFAYDISAYGYESSLQQAYMQQPSISVTGEAQGMEIRPGVEKEHIDEAVKEVDAALQAEAEEQARLEAEKAAAAEAERQAKEEAAAQKAQTVSVVQTNVAVPAVHSEQDLLAQIVMAEAGCEDIQGQIMVANVILNRIRAGYGSSISDIVYAPGQFEPVSSGTLWSVSPTASVQEAVSRALAGEDYSQGALFFVSSACDYSWFMEDLLFVTQHGGHLFFR